MPDELQDIINRGVSMGKGGLAPTPARK